MKIEQVTIEYTVDLEDSGKVLREGDLVKWHKKHKHTGLPK